MNISNLLTVSAAVTIAVAGTIFGQKSEPVINYYAMTPSGCILNSNPGCVSSGTLQCSVMIEGSICPIRKQNDLGSPCVIPMYKNQ